MVKDNVALALTDQAEDLLKPLLDLFMTRPWTKTQAKPLCLLCETADFSGYLVEALAISKDGKNVTKLWLPHSYIALAFDFSQARKVGFH